MNHQEYQELLALHALDALDAPEARAIEAHLGTCAECRGELVELKEAAGLLAYAAPTAEPSLELRARILELRGPETRIEFPDLIVSDGQ